MEVSHKLRKEEVCGLYYPQTTAPKCFFVRSCQRQRLSSRCPRLFFLRSCERQRLSSRCPPFLCYLTTWSSKWSPSEYLVLFQSSLDFRLTSFITIAPINAYNHKVEYCIQWRLIRLIKHRGWGASTADSFSYRANALSPPPSWRRPWLVITYHVFFLILF